MRRLGVDRRGNTMVIMCAALIPLLGLIGSGVDIARAYTAQARLQQACDAAALAGRRQMTTDAITTSVSAEATKFLNFNFPQTMFDTAAFTPQISRPRPGTVSIRAVTTIPTVIMKIFGFETLPVRAVCDASQEFMNIDVVLVLDTTGSMNESMSDGNTKIQALRDSVMAFYDQLKPVQDNLKANGYRLRYAVVPYSSTVNVGRLLYSSSASNIRLSAPYERIYGLYCSDSRCTDIDAYWNMQTISHDSDWIKNSWSGCIEERATISAAGTEPTASEQSQMLDLDIDTPANASDPRTQWLPADGDPRLGTAACPTEAVRLKEWSRDDLNNYVNGLTPVGGTYHDIGMVWGGRFISDAGVFSDSPLAYNGMRTNKYVVFLTDGEMDTGPLSYSAWGVELMQRRVAGGTQGNPAYRLYNINADLEPTDTSKHIGRFNVLCQKVRAKASVWTIKVSDNPMDATLRDCAHPNQWATVSKKADLLNQFSLIAQQITELRLAL
jgi:Flp pilus assembly protein TadG